MREGDYVYLLAPPEKAQALDRFFIDMPPPATARSATARRFLRLRRGDARRARRDLRAADIAASIPRSRSPIILPPSATRPIRQDDVLTLGPIALLASRVSDGRVTTVGLLLAEPEAEPAPTWAGRLRALLAARSSKPCSAEHQRGSPQQRHRTVGASSTCTSSTPNTCATRSRSSAIGRRGIGDDAAAVHHHHAVAVASGKRQIVQDRQHAAAAMRGLPQQIHHDELMPRIERGGRLVGEQDRRFGRKRARQRDTGAFAAGERGHRPRGKIASRRLRPSPRATAAWSRGDVPV